MRGLIRFVVVFTAVAALLVAGTQVASAGPAMDGTYLSVWQSGHVTHRVCDNRPFWVEMTNVFDGIPGVEVIEFRTKSSGQLLRRKIIQLDPDQVTEFVLWRETRLGARHDGRALIKFSYNGSYSIDIVPCPR